ncbi:hypothetical protein [Bacteroides sp.]
MKNFIFICSAIITFCTLVSCDNEHFIDDIYIKPQAKFMIDDKPFFQVFESVHFFNHGTGQKFTVWPGDASHIYGEKGSTGFACNTDGTFSYSYQEPGTYNAVWIASSIKANGDIVFSVDSVKIKVEATEGGLISFSLPRMARLSDYGSSFFYESYGQFIEKDRILCPIPYKLWPNYIRRAVGVKFQLGSTFAKLNWASEGGDVELVSESTAKVLRFDQSDQLQPQILKVITSSGKTDTYEVVAMVIPELTSFSIEGIEGVVSRDLSAFNKFKIQLQLPTDIDRTTLIPSFEVFKNDPNLLTSDKTVKVTVDGITQTSGITPVNFTTPITYVLTYTISGSEGYKYTYDTYYEITVN